MEKKHPIGKKFFAVILSAVFFLLFQPASSKSAGAPPQMIKGYTDNEVIFEVASSSDAAALERKYNLTVTPLNSSDEDTFFLAKSISGKSVQKLIRELRRDPLVKSVQKNFRYAILSRTPNDSYASEQWSLFDTESSAGGVSAFSAWDTETKKGQRNVAIAVIDTGVNPKHKDLKKNLTKGSAKGKNFEYPKKKLSDGDGHGSFISGIIAAKTNNKRGVSGGSFYNHLRVMALRFDFTTAQAITVVNYAKSKSVPVINASWGSYGDEGLDLALKDTIASYPGIFVTASGNEGFNHDDPNPNYKMYPCDFDLANIICVGASDRDGNLTDYSDYGAASVDVAAPGGTDGNELIGPDKKKSRYTSAVGSSLSAAFVSAEAGLIISKYPNLSSLQVIEIIKNSVDASPSFAGKVSTSGKVNFQKALTLAATY